MLAIVRLPRAGGDPMFLGLAYEVMDPPPAREMTIY